MEEYKFKVGENVVYPSHKSIGAVITIEEEQIAGTSISVYKVKFEKENMILHVPINAAIKSGLRPLNSKEYISEKVIAVLKMQLNKKDEAWRTCAAEYENKLNSGNLIMIAEVVRDLFNEGGATYSRRNVYEAALDRLVSEVSIVYSIPHNYAKERLLMIRRGLARTIVEEMETEKEAIEEAF